MMRIAVGQAARATDEYLAFARQIGAQGVQFNTPDLPGERRWELANLVALRERVESYGLRLEAIENVPNSFYSAAMLPARHGSAVELAAIDEPGVAAAVEQIRADGHEARGTVLDVARPEQVEEFFAAVGARHGRLSALVNSAGIQRYGTAETTPVEVWDEVLDVNVRAMFLAAKHAIPLMRRGGGGAIVNVASAQATATQRNVVAYTASKGAIVAMTRAMAVDHAPDGIRVNSVSPGSVTPPCCARPPWTSRPTTRTR